MRDHQSRGFTLIELLVVIAIIAILAAIMFPVFTLAKAAGKKAACISNLRQISSAWITYTDNNSGIAPPLTDPTYTVSWMHIMLPYVKNYKVFGCPASDFIPGSAGDFEGNPSAPGYTAQFPGQLTYGWNTNLFNYPWPPYSFVVRQSDLDRASKTVFVCDSVAANWISLPPDPQNKNSTSVYWDSQFTVYGKSVYGCRPSDRHNGSVSVAFCDGHASCVPYTELLKIEPGNGKRVVFIVNGKPQWRRSTGTGTIFPYFQVTASSAHW
jgi:prepilin-type N-terminal cleavage/methylation domain-containing protein/prepilin-type processing-associated H-X9-DG protein